MLFGLVFVLAGLAFKISAVPFHMWTPDVYEGAPTPVTAFFATAPKVAAMLLATRVCLEALGPAIDAWRQIVIFAALASIVLGALAAIGQTNIKRLLAYSSINNVGFMLIGLAAGGARGRVVGAGLPGGLCRDDARRLPVRAADARRRRRAGRERSTACRACRRRGPGSPLALAMFMFSLAGIPPLFGFWAKFVVFQAAVDADLIALAVVGIAASVIGAFTTSRSSR